MKTLRDTTLAKTIKVESHKLLSVALILLSISLIYIGVVIQNYQSKPPAQPIIERNTVLFTVFPSSVTYNVTHSPVHIKYQGTEDPLRIVHAEWRLLNPQNETVTGQWNTGGERWNQNTERDWRLGDDVPMFFSADNITIVVTIK
jgi:hypothetical protein